MIATQTQPAKNGRPPAELLAKVSASRLQTFHQCRLKFYFRYVLRLEKPKSPALHVGSAVHFVLQTWNRARWKGEPIDLAVLRQMFGSFWVFEQAETPVNWDHKNEPREMDAAWSLARMYLERTPIPPNEKPEAVEVEAEADLSSHGFPTLIGFIDLVRAGGRIVDFKTSAQTPNSERAVHLHELQLSCYGVLYRDATGQRKAALNCTIW